MNRRPRALASSGLLVLAAALASVALERRVAADAPPCRYTISDGTVLDTKTKLTWQQSASTSALAWSAALSSCASLGLAGGGWRAPTLKELQTIVDESQSTPAIDRTAFPNTPAVAFWTATLTAGDASQAWSVAFDFGASQGYPVSSTMALVRCVR